MIRRSTPASALSWVLLFSSLSTAQQDSPIPHAQDRPPGPALSPGEALARMKVRPGFRVELVASEPEIVNPVAMTFDEKGRIWITESLEYPRKSAGPGRDRVKVLEDSDGDGKADKFTVFADGLNIPSGIAVGAGGVWVANAPDILFLRDTDGDGKADTREVVVTGFGRYDTHELPNSLTWGPDGYLYGWNGVFNPARIEYRGKIHEFTCAVFRIDPRTREFEVFCEGTSNPWGITWDKEGSAFASACVIDHLWHLTETGYYHRQGGPYPPFTWKLESIVDHKHQKAAYCGITYFDSDAYPEAYRERLFMGNIHGNGINVDRIDRQGATYRGTTESDFLEANDAWFMPVVQKVGPDGSLYILDWYDRYHCYQDANRDPGGIDRLKGRLYRVRYQETPRAPKFDLDAESDEQLIKRLASPNIYFRETAQRLLRERNPGSESPTRTRLESLGFDRAAPRKARLHAIWTLLALTDVSPETYARLMLDDDATIRAWGVRGLANARPTGRGEEALREVRARVASLASDPSADVRLQVAIASRKIPGLDPMALLFEISAGGDVAAPIPQIAWQNLHPLLEGQGARFAKLLTARGRDDSPGLVEMLPRAIDRLLGGQNPQPSAAVEVLAWLLQSPRQQRNLQASQKALEVVASRLESLGARSDERSKLQAALAGLLPQILADPRSPLYPTALMMAASPDDADARQAIREILRSPSRPESSRLQALEALIGSQDPSILELVEPMLTGHTPGSSSFQGKLLTTLGRLESPKVAEVLLSAYPRLPPDAQPKAVNLLTQRVAWARSLLGSIEAKSIPASALSLTQVRVLQSAKDRGLADQARSIYGIVRESRNPEREKVIAAMKRTLQEAHGDPMAGSLVFRNVCGQCHKIYGEGQEVGPEITLNGRASYEQLLSNVFDPSLVIGTGYQATTLATTDGRILTGLLVEDSPQRITLKLQGGRIESVPRSSVEESKLSPLSLMPEGLETQVSATELADLFAFITLDKPAGHADARPIPGTPPGLRR